LRVLTEADGGAAARLQSALSDAGVQGEVSPVHANLEDVFVAATRGREDARAHAA
jgi:ABC-2 type transport system ATP-binding protein